MDSLPLSVFRFLCKTFPKLLKVNESRYKQCGVTPYISKSIEKILGKNKY